MFILMQNYYLHFQARSKRRAIFPVIFTSNGHIGASRNIVFHCLTYLHRLWLIVRYLFVRSTFNLGRFLAVSGVAIFYRLRLD